MFVFTFLLVLAASSRGGALPSRIPANFLANDGDMGIVEDGEEFNCTGRLYGLYPDTVSGCKMVHVCLPALSRLWSRTISFYCQDDTVFDQNTQSCVRAEIGLPCFKAPVFTRLSTRLSNMINSVVGPIKHVIDPLNIFGSKQKPEDHTDVNEINTGSQPVRFSKIPTNLSFAHLKPYIRPVFTIPLSTGTKLGNFIKGLKPSKDDESTTLLPEVEHTTTSSRNRFGIDIRLGSITDLPEEDEVATTPASAFEDGTTEIGVMLLEEAATTPVEDVVHEKVLVEAVPFTTERPFRPGARMEMYYSEGEEMGEEMHEEMGEEMGVTEEEMPESTTVTV